MPKKTPPELKRYMDKKIRLTLNAKRIVSGHMRGFDQFMNIVLDEAYEERSDTEGFELGTVVRVSISLQNS
jgi:small nuclear ribonucleoprotein G